MCIATVANLLVPAALAAAVNAVIAHQDAHSEAEIAAAYGEHPGSAGNRDFPAVEPWIGQCVVRIDALSRREQDVLRLLGRGLENRAIATTLGIAERTVKQHVTRI